MLRAKLFRVFALIIVVFSVLSALVGMRTIKRQVIQEAQTRVQLDLGGAWSVYDSELRRIEDVLRLVAMKQVTGEHFESKNWTDEDLRSRLERIRVSFRFDFLDLIGTDGNVVMRAARPYKTGDYRTSEGAVMRALKGEVVRCTMVLSAAELANEAEGLAEKAFFEVEATPHARKFEKTRETRGMALVGAVPVYKGATVVGVVYGGILVNRNHDLVDRIRDTVFRDDAVRKKSMGGTATIFLDDVRVATTVRGSNGNRALGTRVSKEVADRVLDNALPWVGEAFVVQEPYLSAYEPIRDAEGEVMGMLYVGILKRPFVEAGRNLVMIYLVLSLVVLAVALALSFYEASRLAHPIHMLVEASRRLSDGHAHEAVKADGGCRETGALVHAFNDMAGALAEREEKLKALNRSYMETVGFVAHELKSPVATMTNYVWLLEQGRLGELTDGQRKAVHAIEVGSQRLVEMVRHYLNLSRIENGELDPACRRMAVVEEVIGPLLDAEESRLKDKAMPVENRVGAGVVLNADTNMVREVFDNLIGNAIKYGRREGRILIDCREADGMAEFRVRNEGPGIPPEKMGLLFQKFTRIEQTEAARRERGTGLGLFITRHIVEAHGGAIRAESKAGEWAEFVFTLPLYQSEQA